jgi:hypothetical protein
VASAFVGVLRIVHVPHPRLHRLDVIALGDQH